MNRESILDPGGQATEAGPLPVRLCQTINGKTKRMPEESTAAEPETTEGYFRTGDGVRLFQRRVKALGELKGHIVIIHGYAEHCDRYQFVTDYFAPKGWDCWTVDLRGHGESEGARGFVNRFEEYFYDISAFLDQVKQQRQQSQPLFLIGHSMGALAVSRWLEVKSGTEELKGLNISGVVLSSPFFALKLKVPGLKRAAAALLSGLLPRLALANELKASDLTRDEAVQKVWEADPKLVKKIPTRWFTEALKAQKEVFRDCARIQIPITIHHGEDDPVADPKSSERLFDLLTVEDKSYKRWAGLRHEIFNEIERQLVFGEIEQWLNTHR
jgi:lysophospholipase